MKIISLNVNGIRAASRRGFLKWLKEENPDIACFQEIKSQETQKSLFSDYLEITNSAQRKGYSGVAVFAKIKPRQIFQNLGLKRFDQEGRILELDFSNFSLINLYLPHGARDKRNLSYKLAAYQHLLNKLDRLKNKNLILAGDFNIAHQEIDLARPKQNQNNIMFTPKERLQLDKLVHLGFVDSFRKFNQKDGNYTWWPYRQSVRAKNIGWRLDYIFVSKSLAPKLKRAFILKEVSLSDHCPIGVEINL